MATFTHDITYTGQVFDPAKGWVETDITKTVTFKELDKKDKEQRELQFGIVFAVAKNTSKSYCDITTDFCESMIVINQPVKDAQGNIITPVDPNEFSESDKAEFLNDNGAIINFSFWLMKEKITPFFPTLKIK